MVGHTDEPLHAQGTECLGVTGHMEALAQFIQQCNTPMTIAIQGDWGTGKTSMMNLVRDKLTGQGIHTVWFNTWQFSQFAMQDDVPLVLLMELLSAVGYDKEQMKSLAFNLVRRLAVLGAGVVAGAEGSAAVDRATREDPVALVSQIKDLKQKLDTAVRDKIAKSKTDRLVIFVDDLDRMAPEKAVELLEVVKNFLDIKGCIFVLAVDYGVVSRGVRKKYGDDMDELKGRSFFDKIIQLPFNLPVNQYDTKSYMRAILDITDEDVDIYVRLAQNSVGTNPRTLKRMANALDLLDIVARNKKDAQADRSGFRRTLFAVLCLQMAYEPVYSQIIQQNQVEHLLGVESKRGQDADFSLALAQCPSKEETQQRFVTFAEALRESLPHLSEGDDLTAEVLFFRDVLNLSGTTSSSGGGDKGTVPTGDGFDPALLDALREMRGEVQRRYASYMTLLDAPCDISGQCGETLWVSVTPGDTISCTCTVRPEGLFFSFYTEEYVAAKRDFYQCLQTLLPQEAKNFTYNGRRFAFLEQQCFAWTGEAAAAGTRGESGSRITQTKRMLFAWLDKLLPALEQLYTPKIEILRNTEELRQQLYSQLAAIFPVEEGWRWDTGKPYVSPLLNIRKESWPTSFVLRIGCDRQYMGEIFAGVYMGATAQSPEAKDALNVCRHSLQASFGTRYDTNNEWVMWGYLPSDLRHWIAGSIHRDDFANNLTPEQEKAAITQLVQDMNHFKAVEDKLDALARCFVSAS